MLLIASRELGWLLHEIANGVYQDPGALPGPALKRWAAGVREKIGG